MEFRGGEGLIDIFMRLVAAKLSETNIANLANVVKNDSVLKNIFGNLMIYRLLHIWIVCFFHAPYTSTTKFGLTLENLVRNSTAKLTLNTWFC